MKLPPLALLTLAGVGGLPTAALGHGVIIEKQSMEAIEVIAKYDTGEPLPDAQVLVFSPDDPQNAWFQGRTDSFGRFWFRPDQAVSGTWEVMVRQAGHGGIVTVEVADDNADVAVDSTSDADAEAISAAAASNHNASSATASANAAGLSPGHQMVLMGTTVWGFIGTALFFWRRKN